MNTVHIATDGSCFPNPGPGGWACILKDDMGRQLEASGGASDTTNNRMEVTALIEALKRLRRPCNVVWTTDSQYAILIFRRAYKMQSNTLPKRLKNRDIIRALWRTIQEGRHTIEAVWVRGHTGHPENERCDKLAEEQRLAVV